MKNLLLLTALSLLISSKLLSQSTGNGGKFNAEQNAGGMSDGIVNPYNGQINYTVPLYTIVEGDIVVPISMSYTSSGILAFDRGGDLGMGWSLNYGGAISREIKGKDDFTATNNLLNQIYSSGNACQIDQQGYLNGSYDAHADLTSIFDPNATEDSELDIYTASFNGNFLKFCIHPLTGNIIKLSPGDFTIERINKPNNAFEFRINDLKGITYIFGGGEPYMQRSTVDFNLFSGPDLLNTSVKYTATPTLFFLKRIESISNHAVDFNYCQSCIYENTQNDTTYFKIEGTLTNSNFITNIDETKHYLVGSNQPRILGIEWPGGIMSFERGLLAHVPPNNFAMPIKRICVRNKGLTKVGTIQKEITFGYVNSNVNARKWLEGYNVDGNRILTFHYYTYPSFHFQNPFGDEWNLFNNYDPNGTYSPTHLDKGLLNEIISHSKEKINIQYEPHSYLKNGVEHFGAGVRVKNVISNDGVRDYITNYDYIDPNTNQTSGKLTTAKSQNWQGQTRGAFCLLFNVDVDVRATTPLFASGSSGSNVGYDFVTIKQYNHWVTNLLGKELIHFYNEPNEIIPITNITTSTNNFIFAEATDNSWRNGTVKYTKTFNSSGVLINESTYNYSVENINSSNIYSVKFGGQINPSECPNLKCELVGYQLYHPNNNYLRLNSKSTTSYDVNGQSPISNTSNYYYHPTLKYSVASSSVTNSDGSILRSYNRFLLDVTKGTFQAFQNLGCVGGGTFLNDNTCAIQRLRFQKNAFLLNLESYTTIQKPGENEKVTSSSLTLYKPNPDGVDLYMVEKQMSLKLSEPIDLSQFTLAKVDGTFGNMSFNIDSRYEEDYQIIQRDKYHHKVLKRGKLGINPSSIIYDKHGQNLKASISNAKYSETEDNINSKEVWIGNEFGMLDYEIVNDNPNDYAAIGGFSEEALINYWTPGRDALAVGGYFSSNAHTGNQSLKLPNPAPANANYNKNISYYKIFKPDNQNRSYAFSAWTYTDEGFVNPPPPNPNTTKPIPYKIGLIVIQPCYYDNGVFQYLPAISQEILSTNGEWKKAEITANPHDLKLQNGIPTTTQLYLKCYVKTAPFGTTYDPLVDTLDMLVDDMRFQPIDAFVSTVVIDRFYRQVATFDNYNDPVSINELDALGRVVKVLDKNRDIRAVYNYHQVDENVSGDLNYTEEIVFKQPYKTYDGNTANYDCFISKSYTDRSGAPLQNVVKQGSPLGFDVVTPFVYDEFKRSHKQYLSYVANSTDGSYQANAVDDVQESGNVYNFYSQNIPGLESTTKPYTQTVFEQSTISRVTEQAAQGEAHTLGSGHTTTINRATNASNEVQIWNMKSPLYTGAEFSGNYYSSGELVKTKVKDETGKEVISFSDKTGKVICTKFDLQTTADNETFDFTEGTTDLPSTQHQGNVITLTLWTYNIYDDFGRLIYTIPAKVYKEMQSTSNFAFSETDDLFLELMSAVHYDNKFRIVESKSPGIGWKYLVYDKLNRPVLSQDANMKNNQKWSFVKYDEYGRTIITGLYNAGTSRVNMQLTMDNQTATFESAKSTYTGYQDYYTNSVFPNSNIEFLSISIYDKYTSLASNLSFDNSETQEVHNTKTLGMLTESVTGILNSTTVLVSKSYYDNNNRLLQSSTSNIAGGWDVVTLKYDFLNNVLETKRKHKYDGGATPLSIANRVEYDKDYRVKAIFQTTGNDPEVKVSANEYNELSMLVRKHLDVSANGSSAMQSIDFRYNIRGWLTHINNATLEQEAGINPDLNDVFGEQLNYYDNLISYSTGKNAIPYYDGKISSISWKTKGPNSNATIKEQNAYIYRYDELNRMTAAYFASTNPQSAHPYSFAGRHDYFNESVTYDFNGNIKKLTRNDGIANPGSLVKNDITYNYFYNGMSNRLMAIDDPVGGDVPAMIDYMYDANANIIADINKDLQTSYNVFNLPQQEVINGHIITNTYAANGTKLRTTEGADVKTYIGGIQYTNNELDYLPQPEGRVRYKSADATNSTDFVYDYYIRDHLGNVRVVMTNETVQEEYLATMENGNTTTEQELFDNVPETREPRSPNAPPDSTYQPDYMVSRTNAGADNIGHAKILKVYEGDELNFATTYFYHDSMPSNTNNNPVSSILNQLASIIVSSSMSSSFSPDQTAAAAAQFASANSPVGSFVSNTLSANNLANPLEPTAFLMYLFFDSKLNLIEQKSGALQVSQAESLEALDVTNFVADRQGFLYIYVNNESDADVDFDNLHIYHNHGRVLEVNEYYPYGLLNTSLGWSNTTNQYKYQTKQWLPQHDYNLYDFGARMYDPVLARFTTPDPLMQFNNPYLAMGANPVSMVDPSGMWSGTTNLSESQVTAQEMAEASAKAPHSGFGGGGVSIDGLLLNLSSTSIENIAQNVMQHGGAITYPEVSMTYYYGYNSAGQSAGMSASYNGAIKNVIASNAQLSGKKLTDDNALYKTYRQNGEDDRNSNENNDRQTGYMYRGQFMSIEDLGPYSPSDASNFNLIRIGEAFYTNLINIHKLYLYTQLNPIELNVVPLEIPSLFVQVSAKKYYSELDASWAMSVAFDVTLEKLKSQCNQNRVRSLSEANNYFLKNFQYQLKIIFGGAPILRITPFSGIIPKSDMN